MFAQVDCILLGLKICVPLIPGLTCGPKQTFAWTAPVGTGPSLSERIPFVLDVCEETFRLIDQLLTEVWEGLDGRRDWPPKQEQECIAVSCLNLLKLQLHAMLIHRYNTNPLSITL